MLHAKVSSKIRFGRTRSHVRFIKLLQGRALANIERHARDWEREEERNDDELIKLHPLFSEPTTVLFPSKQSMAYRESVLEAIGV